MSQTLYDNLDNCCNLLFNAFYGKTDKVYSIMPIKRKAITINDLRKPLNYDFTNVFTDCTFKFIGVNNNRLEYKRTNKDNTSCTVSIGSNKLNQNDLTRHELQHMAMLYMGSEIVFNEKFFGMVLPIMCFDINKNDVIKNLTTFESDLKNSKLNFGDKLYCVITEHFFKTVTLKAYLDEIYNDKNKIIKVLFLVLYNLAKLTERFNNFTHRNLNLESILVWKKIEENSTYKISILNFEVTTDIELKFTNFDNSYTSDYNTDYENTNFYYDVFFFVNELKTYLKTQNKLTHEIENIINTLISEKYKNLSYEEIEHIQINSEELLMPIDILKKNKIFKDFIKNGTIDNS